MSSEETTTYANVQFMSDGAVVDEKQFDLYKTKLGVHTSDMWYAIVCHTNNDFGLAGIVEEWAMTAEVGSTYKSDKVHVKIVK